MSDKELEEFKMLYGFEFLDTDWLRFLIENDEKVLAEVRYWGIFETETRSLIFNLVSQKLVGTPYPIYEESIDIDKFFENMRLAYKELH